MAISPEERDRAKQLGKAYADGAIGAACGWLFWLAVFMLVIEISRSALGYGHDDCDASRWEHCGVHVVTDSKTGLQFLITPQGGIVPRVPSP